MKHYFSPIPNRAIFDDQITGRKMKILALIATHDRMGRNGQHCTLSVRRIGERLGVDFSNVRKDIADLIERGYLSRSAHPTHRQRWQLAVIYDDAADLAAVKHNRGSSQPRSDGKTVVADDHTEDINPKVYKKYSAAEAAASSQCEADGDLQVIFGDYEDSSEHDDFEPSLAEMDDFGMKLTKEANDAIFLRKLGEACDFGCRYSPEIAELLYSRLTDIHDAYEIGDPLGGWAYRILQNVELDISA